jgi:hypothetical protein
LFVSADVPALPPDGSSATKVEGYECVAMSPRSIDEHAARIAASSVVAAALFASGLARWSGVAAWSVTAFAAGPGACIRFIVVSDVVAAAGVTSCARSSAW